MGIDNSFQVRALVAAAALESQLGHLPTEVYSTMAPAVADAKRALEKLFRDKAGFFIGDNVKFAMCTYRMDALVIKDGLVAVEMRKLKKDGKPSAIQTWTWLSAGLHRA